MSRILIILAVVSVFGCSGNRSYDVANPVVGPPPPRYDNAEQIARAADAQGVIQQASFDTEAPLSMTTVIARVNGTPILAGQVLEPYAAKLAQASKQLPASEIRKAQEGIIKRELPPQIEQTIMVNEVKSKLTEEQLSAIDEQLDKFFDIEIEKMKAKAQVSNLAELEGALQQQGMSLVTLREMFGDRQLAGEYIKGRVTQDAPVTRAELLEEYNRRREEYAQPEQVKWQQLQVTFASHGSRSRAGEVYNKAIAELKAGSEFTDLVKKYSDGPLKDSGGHWDWTQPQSIANVEVRKSLAELPVGNLSQTIETDKAFLVVKLTGHRPASYTPFEEVQEEIRKSLINRRQEEQVETIIAELKDQAVIETMFDEGFFGGGVTLQ
ncbi:Chaperone SurA precursor [Thalassoglobus neptunius]|uniref:Chaperone SurA n=1 Tax=Thalassoglobus neptunius TaxID=1938619 RepID=A0A5C5WQG4_9PLAN|nr:peptidyl-prolyl cis-trans isomerase [Thalassoglobus neptunius]TWT52283.1 Chaperone SurA precursor [Thalassoglobus neptunius]